MQYKGIMATGTHLGRPLYQLDAPLGTVAYGLNGFIDGSNTHLVLNLLYFRVGPSPSGVAACRVADIDELAAIEQDFGILLRHGDLLRDGAADLWRPQASFMESTLPAIIV